MHVRRVIWNQSCFFNAEPKKKKRIKTTPRPGLPFLLTSSIACKYSSTDLRPEPPSGFNVQCQPPGALLTGMFSGPATHVPPDCNASPSRDANTLAMSPPQPSPTPVLARRRRSGPRLGRLTLGRPGWRTIYPRTKTRPT